MFTPQKIREIRSAFNLTQEELALALGLTRELVNKMESGKRPVSKATRALLQQFVQERTGEHFSHEVFLEGKAYSGRAAQQPYFQQRQEQKMETADPFVPLVGIKAQAGYVKGYEQVDFMNTLEKYSLPPGVKAGGAEWSYFEIDGDSMEPTLSAGDIVLASVVHAEDWQDLRNFCVYVLLTADSLMVKRVFRKSPEEWVLISDNDDYPQKILNVSSLKEIWTVRRHIYARIPSRHFEITI
jgi:phage repressor protein C with HTH and peptisase S24 domain